MLKKINDSLLWLPSYLKQVIKNRNHKAPEHVFFSICDHYEPYWGGVDRKTARKRINRWMDEYPKIAASYPDSDGLALKYTFFYPEEEYRHDDMKVLEGLCNEGFGEVEIHLHHDNDTPENLTRTLTEFKKRLYYDHGLLSRELGTDEVRYGFIHGNWALDNSRPDGRWCGVNNEIDILQETGCYADFTMPSAPSDTQTSTINSIYYATDDPLRPKSHDRGVACEVGKRGQGLLMVQGPLALNWNSRKFGIVPRIENGGLMGGNPPTNERVRSWVGRNIHVRGCPECVFIKIHTHGTQEKNMDMLFDEGHLDKMLEGLLSLTETDAIKGVHFVSAREMTNIIRSIEAGNEPYCIHDRDRYLVRPCS